MLDNRAFADFCYEQPNYFTADSIREGFRLNGFVVDKITAEFGNQYLWVEGLISPENPDLSGHKNHAITLTTNYLQDYFLQEQDNLANIRSFLQQKKREQRHVVVWGASTKGILFNFLIDPECNLVDQCVDINIDKQGKFLPVTGKLIQSPEKILEKTANPVIIIMNPNYKSEIIALCQSYNLQAEFYEMDQI
jgi:hypothetical protein